MAALASGCKQGTESATAANESAAAWSPLVSENVGDLEPETLTWLAQLGLQHVVLQGTDWVDASRKGYWTSDDLGDLVNRCERYGLTLHSLMIPIAWLMNAMLGRPERDNDIERISRSVRAAGSVGIRMIEWRWSPDFK